jgi:hypothetical protein
MIDQDDRLVPVSKKIQVKRVKQPVQQQEILPNPIPQNMVNFTPIEPIAPITPAINTTPQQQIQFQPQQLNLEEVLNNPNISNSAHFLEPMIIGEIIKNDKLNQDLFSGDGIRIKNLATGQDTIMKKVNGWGKKQYDIQISKAIETKQDDALLKEILHPVAVMRGDKKRTIVIQDNHQFAGMIDNALGTYLDKKNIRDARYRFDLKTPLYKNEDFEKVNNARKELILKDVIILDKEIREVYIEENAEEYVNKITANITDPSRLRKKRKEAWKEIKKLRKSDDLTSLINNNIVVLEEELHEVYSRQGAIDYANKMSVGAIDKADEKRRRNAAYQELKSLRKDAYIGILEQYPEIKKALPWTFLTLLLSGTAVKIAKDGLEETLDEVNDISNGKLGEAYERFSEILGLDNDDPDPTDPIIPDTNYAPEIYAPDEWVKGKENELYRSNSFKITDPEGSQVNASIVKIDPAYGDFEVVSEGNDMYHIEGLPKANGSLEFRLDVDDGENFVNKNIQIPFDPEVIPDPNRAPVPKDDAVTEYNATEGKEFSVNIDLFEDPDGDQLTPTRLKSDSEYVNIDGTKVNITKPGSYIVVAHTTDGELESELEILVKVVEPIPKKTAPEFLIPDSIEFEEDKIQHYELKDILKDDKPIENVNFSAVSLTPEVNASYVNGTLTITPEEDFTGPAQILIKATDLDDLTTEKIVNVNVTKIYDPMQILGFNLTQDKDDGNFYDLDLSLKAKEAKIGSVQIRLGDELIKEIYTNSYEVDLVERINLSDFAPGNRPINITAISQDNLDVTIINNYINVQNDIDLTARVTGEGEVKTVSGTAYGDDDNITRLNIRSEVNDETIDDVDFFPNTREYEFSHNVNLSGYEGDESKHYITAYDESGGIIDLTKTGSNPNTDATIYNISHTRTRNELIISYTVKDTDNKISGAQADIPNIGVVQAEAVDGVFGDENEEEVRVVADITSLDKGQDVDVDIGSHGASESISIDIPNYASHESTENSFGYRSFNLNSLYRADTDYNITDIIQEVDSGEDQEVSIIQGNTVWANTTINVSDKRGLEVTVINTIYDDVDPTDPITHENKFNVPGLPSIGTESVEQEKGWYNISIPLEDKGLTYKEFKFKQVNGSWQQGKINGNTGKMNINTTNMIGKTTYITQAIDEWDTVVEKEIEVDIDAEDKIYETIFKHRLNEGNNEDNHRTLVNDLIDNLGDVTVQDYYNGLDAIVNGLNLNKTETNDLLQHLALGELSASEVAAASNLYEMRPDLTDYPALFQWYLEWDSIKDRVINTTDDQMIDDGIDIVEDMDATEKLMLNLDQILSVDNRAARIGDWFFNQYAPKKGLDMSDEKIGRFGFYYPAVFDGFKVDNSTFDYIPKQLEFFEEAYDSLSNLAESGVAIPVVIRPWISLSPNINMDRDAVFIPINESFNGYEWAKEKFEEWDVYDQVVGKPIHDGLSDWFSYVSNLTDDSGEVRQSRIENWSRIYDTIDKLEQEKYDIDCNTEAKLEELLRVVGLWTDSNGNIRKTYSPGYIAMGVSAVNAPNHVGAVVYHKTSSGVWQHWGDRMLGIINTDYHKNDPEGQRYRVDSPTGYIHNYKDSQLAQKDLSQNISSLGAKEVMVKDKFVNVEDALNFLNQVRLGSIQWKEKEKLINEYAINS